MNLFENCQDVVLKEFIEKTAQGFLSKLGKGEYEEYYYDLWNLPGVLVRMQAVGLEIPTSDIVAIFHQYAFSLHHFESMLDFKKLYPDTYDEICQPYLLEISRRIDDLVIAELYDLLDLDMDHEIDMILEGARDVYNEMGWDYSCDFEINMYEAAEREYYLDKFSKPKYREEDIEEDNYEKPFLQCQLEHTWILGPAEKYLESDKRKEVLDKKDIPEEMKCRIISELEEGDCYIHHYIETEEDVDFYFDILQKHNYKTLPEGELEFLMAVLLETCENDFSITGKMIDVLTICYSIFWHYEEPVVREELFYCDEDIGEYLKDEKVKQIFENYYMRTDGVWIRFNHVPVFILAFVMTSVNMGRLGEDELDYESIFVYGDSVKHVRNLNSRPNTTEEELYYSEIGSYPFNNIEWEFCMHRLYEAYDPWEFNKKYVYKAIEEVLNSIRNNDLNDEVKALIKRVELAVFHEEKENIWSFMYSSDCYIDLLINLGLLEIDVRRDIPVGTEKVLKQLNCEESVGWGNATCYSLIKIDDYDVLKEVIEEQVLHDCIIRLKRIYERFKEGYFIITDMLFRRDFHAQNHENRCGTFLFQLEIGRFELAGGFHAKRIMRPVFIVKLYICLVCDSLIPLALLGNSCYNNREPHRTQVNIGGLTEVG